MKLDGMKTYAVAIVMVAVGGLELVGVDIVPSVNQSNAFDYIMAGLAIATGRSALKKVEK